MPHGDEQYRFQELLAEGAPGNGETGYSLDELRVVYAGAVLSASGRELAERIHGPEGQIDDLLATLYQAHVVRAEAAPYDKKSYRQDVESHPAIHQLVQRQLGGKYFQSAIEDVTTGNADDSQLGVLLNTLHGGLAHAYGLHQPPRRDGLPIFRDSTLISRQQREILDARAAVVNFVYTLPYTPNTLNLSRELLRGPGLAQHRLVAEVEFFLRTKVPDVPSAIQAARYARLTSAVRRPRVVNDMSEYMPMGYENNLPGRTKLVLAEASQYGPSQDPAWLRWLLAKRQ